MAQWEIAYYILKAWNLGLDKFPLNSADQVALRVIKFQSAEARKKVMEDFQKRSNLRESFMIFAEEILDIKAERQLGLAL
jgi:hypothetical protein